jgi:hypothetical protein
MDFLTNKKDLFNHFKEIFEEIINTRDLKISDLTREIKNKSLKIASRMFELWFEANI